MSQGIYISSVNPNSGKSLITLGLVEALHRRAGRIGFFRPLAGADDIENDPMVALIRRRFQLDPDFARAGLSVSTARSLLASGRREDIAAQCVRTYAQIAAHVDVVIVEGADATGTDPALEFTLNAQLANDLGALVLAVISADGKEAPEIADLVDLTRKELTAVHANLLAIMVNRAAPEGLGHIQSALRPGARNRPVYVLPALPQISRPTVAEVASQLDLHQMAGSRQRDRELESIRVGAMSVGNFLRILEADDLVIAPADRSDILVATVASAHVSEFPVPSGMILTGDMSPDQTMMPLLAQAPFPVFVSHDDTYTTTRRVSKVRAEIWSPSERKFAAALGAWSKYVDETELLKRLDLPRPSTMTPLRFLHELIEKARGQRRHIVLPEGEDERIIRAAEILHRRDVCELTILGKPGQVRALAASCGVDLSGITILNPATSPQHEEFADQYATLRAHKGVDLARAREIMGEAPYFGTMMVKQGLVDGMVSGAAHTTAHTIRPALEFIKTAPGVALVSSVFLMLMSDRVLVYGDCAVNPEPNEEQLAGIAIASAGTAQQFGVEPRIAMLSYSTGASGAGAAVERVRRAAELVKQRRPDLAVEGPIQYDAAVNTSIGATKMPRSEVAGHATVFIFPDLNTGNNTYKAVQQSSGAVAVGPILQGLRQPINDLSRGCTVEDIVNTVAITAIQAQGAEELTPAAAPEGKA